MKYYEKINNCRLCQKKELINVIDLKKTPLANSYRKKKRDSKKLRKIPLVVSLCKYCNHLQLRYIANPELMFNDYLYVSGTSKVTKDHFRVYSSELLKVSKIKKKSQYKLIEIASNDGTFLDNFDHNKNIIVGIDPAKNLKKIASKKSRVIINDYFDYKKSIEIQNKYGLFDFIVANNVFAHVKNLNSFTKGVSNLISNIGIFVFEVSYLPNVIKKKTFDTIYHEHMSFHSIIPLIHFFNKFNLQIFDYKLIKVQGGSIRIYVSKKDMYKIQHEKVNKLIFLEKNTFKLNKINTYKKFYNQIYKNKLQTIKNLDILKKNNFKIIGYGAAAKTTTLLSFFGINENYIDYIIDDNPLKQGHCLPGTEIKIVPKKYIKKLRPTHILILAWNFSSSIIKQNSYLFKFGIKFILPFPKFRIISK